MPPPPGMMAGQPYGATHPAATAALVCGLVANTLGCCCSFLGIPVGIGAIVCGIVAIARIRAQPEAYRGEGPAIAGIVLGAIGTMSHVAMLFFGFGAQFLQKLLKL